MIDRAATIEKFGHDPDELKPKSGKRVVAVCDGCGKVRDVCKRNYYDLCVSCAKKKYFEDPKAREKNSARRKKYYEDNPEAGREYSVKMKKYWKDPNARKKQSDAKKRYYQDTPDAREKNSARRKKYFEDPKAREKASAAQKKRFEDPKACEELSAAQKKYYKDTPIAREKNSARRKKYYEDNPKAKRKQSVKMKEYYQDPEAHQRHSAAIQGIDYDDWEAFAKDQPYCPAFNETCRESNREKYGRRCFICDLPESENITRSGEQKRLSVHHVDLNKNQGCDGHDWRLIPTCIHHHSKVIHTPLWIGRIMYLLRVGA